MKRAPASHPFWKTIAGRLALIAGLSGLLGFTYNSANPIGIRFSSGPETKEAGPGAGATQAAAARSSLPEPLSAVSWTFVKPMVERGAAVLVDARPRGYYDAGHIPGAVSLPSDSSAEVLAEFGERYGRDTPLVVYCVSPTCPLSKQLADRLVAEQGRRFVWVMPGGYEEWMLAESRVSPSDSLSVTAEDASVTADETSGSFIPMVAWAEVKPLLGSGQVILVDARPRSSFDAGHIPGAISLPHSSPVEEFVMFEQQVGLETPIVVYCGGQNCAISKQLSEKLVQEFGFANVRYMSGGYEEWQRAERTGRNPGS